MIPQLVLGAFLLSETLERDRKFIEARAFADSLGKPMLVVGGPYGATPWRKLLMIPAHPCGDVTVDITPSALGDCAKSQTGDVRSLPFGDKEFGSAYCSHVLEHLETVEDCRKAISELYRVADKVFVCSPSVLNPWSYLNLSHHLVVEQHGDTITAKPLRNIRARIRG